MARTTEIAVPWDFTVAHCVTVGFRVFKKSVVAGREVLEPENLEDGRYSLWIRGKVAGATSYLFQKAITKADGRNGYFEGFLDAFATANAGKSVTCWVVLIDAGLAPGNPTISGNFEEIVAEFTRQIIAAPVPA